MLRIVVFGATQDQVPTELQVIADSVVCEEYDLEKMMEPIEPSPSIILCYPPHNNMSTLEFAQTLRMNYPELPIFFIASEKKDFDKKKLIKNGFTQAYLLPWEKADFLKALREESVFSMVPELRDYQVIKVVDLTPGTILDFDLKLYLPRNNKLVQFSHEGDPVSEEKFSRLFDNQFNTLFVHKDEIEKFRRYTAETFKKLLRPNKMSETERQEKLENCVRDLISDMFIEDTKENTFGKSQSLLNEIKEIIKLLLTEDDTDLAKKVGLLVNQEGNFYLHLSNVSTFAGLFAIVLGFERPEDMALAGLLHDIGKINLPSDIADKEMEELGPHALEAYKKHPNYSIDVARMKRIALPDAVIRGILHHHEAVNGSGYPAGIMGSKLSKEGRLLAIANAFDHLTTLKPGENMISFRQVLIDLHKENSIDPSRMKLDPEMLKKLKDFFTK